MVELLKNKNSLEKFPQNREEKETSSVIEENKSERKTKSKPVNINKFKDPENLSVKKMEIGLWILENRKHFLFLLTLLFASISIVTWSVFVFNFGGYVVKGMQQDKMLSQNLLDSMVVGHDYYMARAPKKLQYESVKVLNNLDGVYDFVVRVKNLNPDYWVEVDYSLVSGNENLGEDVAFILPGEEKNFIVVGRNLDQRPTNVKMEINEEKWHRIDNHIYPDWQSFYDSHLNVPVKEVSFVSAKETILTEKVDLNTLSFTVLNDSAYNYWDVGFIIILYNGNKIVGADKYTLDQFMSDQKRTVDITWPGDFGRVTDISIIPELNITKDDIYIEFNTEILKGNE